MPAPLDPECILRVLAEYQVECVLVGGLGAVLHGSPAMTNDVDIVPRRDPDNLARLSQALRNLDARLRVADDPEGVAFDPHPAILESMAMLNMTTRCGDLDLTFAPAALTDYNALLAASMEFELSGYVVRVAALNDIIRSKEAADRPKDRATLPLLRALADEIGK
ncbi:MAG: hypothetical protein ACRDWA_08270 [Acidimicrobiia bacterium]